MYLFTLPVAYKFKALSFRLDVVQFLTHLNLFHASAFLSRSFTSAQWKDVMVGDVLRIHKDQVIPVRRAGWMCGWRETDTQRNCECCLQQIFLLFFYFFYTGGRAQV